MKQLKLYFNQFPFWWAIKFSLLHIINKLGFRHYNLSYSQSGEDRVYTNLRDISQKGFYIDIGANDPMHLSNTFLLYNKGWKGITIDANQTLIDKHKRIRTKDRAICAALDADFGNRTFFQFEDSAYNTMNEEVFSKVSTYVKTVHSTVIPTFPLNHILHENIDFIPDEIDLLSIDVEGLDFEIIRTLDFDRFKPKTVIIEMHGFDLSHPENTELYRFMIGKKYRLIGYAAMNGYFERIS